LLGGLVEEGFDHEVGLLWDGSRPVPTVPPGKWRFVEVTRRRHGRWEAYEDELATAQDLANIRPALYHALHLTMPSTAPCPIAVTLHDLIPWALGGPRLWMEQIRYRPARRRLKTADLVIAVSGATADDAVSLARVPDSRVQIIPEGVESVFAPAEGAADRIMARWGVPQPFLLNVGALDARKDPRALVRAWRQTRSSHPELSLVLAGDPGPQAPRDMPGHRLGVVDTKELVDLLTAAACLVFPSRYEGFGLPVLEAMACACPVVAYRNSSLPELLGEGGILVQDGDSEALADAVVELIDSPSRAQEMGRLGLRRASEYTWSRTARMTVTAYRDLLR
jgi:glycosyltransferase involved in cell wall biosynthesis